MNNKVLAQTNVNQRNVGIDLLRIIAMFLIVLGHIVRFSFNYSDEGFPHNDIRYIILDCISNITLVGVNAYAMISGYVMVKRTPHISKLLPIWLQLFFISLTMAFVAKLIHIDLADKPLWKFALPISQNCWWYMTAYFGRYPLLPFVNRALNNMSKKELLVGGYSLLSIFCLLPLLAHNAKLFQLEFGYSVIWLLVCYILGAMLFIMQDDIESLLTRIHLSSSKMLLCTVLLLILLTLINDCVLTLPILGRFLYCLYYSYVSPIMVIYAIALILFFSKLKIGNKWQKSIVLLSSLTLTIYLIHCHPIVFKQLFFSPAHRILAQNHSLTQILGISFGYALFLFITSAVLGFCQIRLFKFIGNLLSICNLHKTTKQ